MQLEEEEEIKVLVEAILVENEVNSIHIVVLLITSLTNVIENMVTFLDISSISLKAQASTT